MPKVLPLSEVKAKLSEIVDKVFNTQERVTVTGNGRPVAVLVSVDDLDAIEETMAILSDPRVMKELREGQAALAAGDYVDEVEIEKVRDWLRSRVG
ncbi:MAG: type II toxin-antitoxin system Phd/YefM family antitoxin [Acidimicrobiia bacterium]